MPNSRKFPLLLIAATVALTGQANAYRPFISTDAAVADFHQIELEMGYFGLTRNGGSNTYNVPLTVLNYGVWNRTEAVGQFEVDKSAGQPALIGNSSLSVKVVAKEGLLQNKPGGSLAFETAVLLPSPEAGQKRTGFEETGIWSQQLPGLLCHFNLGTGVDQVDSGAFLFWGLIAERPLTKTFRLVGEITGQSQPEEPPDNSGLIGLIWDTPKPDLALDAGVRRGLSSTAPDWQFTAGFSYGFTLR